MINPELKKTIQALKTASKKRNAAIWAKLADDLDTSKRSRVSTNLSNINRHTKADQVVAVPGKVLASGALGHPVTVAAFAFSDAAVDKISAVGGRTMNLIELLEEGIEPSKIKVLK